MTSIQDYFSDFLGRSAEVLLPYNEWQKKQSEDRLRTILEQQALPFEEQDPMFKKNMDALKQGYLEHPISLADEQRLIDSLAAQEKKREQNEKYTLLKNVGEMGPGFMSGQPTGPAAYSKINRGQQRAFYKNEMAKAYKQQREQQVARAKAGQLGNEAYRPQAKTFNPKTDLDFSHQVLQKFPREEKKEETRGTFQGGMYREPESPKRPEIVIRPERPNIYAGMSNMSQFNKGLPKGVRNLTAEAEFAKVKYFYDMIMGKATPKVMPPKMASNWEHGARIGKKY